VHRAVVEIAPVIAFEVAVDEGSDGGGAVGEAEGDGGDGEGEEVAEEEGALGGFSAAVDSFEEDEGSSFGGGWGCQHFGGVKVGVVVVV